MNITPHLKEMMGTLVAVALVVFALLVPSTYVAYAVTVIIAIIAWLRPKDTIFFLLFYYPMRSFLVEVNPSLKLVGDLVIVVVLLRIVWASRRDLKSLFRFEPFEWAFIAFLLVGSISGFMTGVSIGAIIFQLRAFVITFLLLYIVKRLHITKEDIFRFLAVTVVVALLIIVQGLVEKLSMRSAWMPERWINRQLSPNNASRIYGLLNNPNVLAVYLSFAGMAGYVLREYFAKQRMWKYTLSIFLIALSGVWILTFSRGTWIAYVVGIVTYFLITRRFKFIVHSLMYIALGFVFVVTPVTYSAQWISENTTIGDFERTGTPEDFGESIAEVEKARIKETFDEGTLEKSRTTGRLFIVDKGFEVFLDYPILGSGFATFGDSASKSYSSPIYEQYGIDVNIYSDNQYIQIIAQTGAVGVLLFAVFLLGMLWTFWKYRRDFYIALPMFAILMATYWSGLIYNIWEDKTFTMYFYIVLGVLLSRAKEKETGRTLIDLK